MQKTLLTEALAWLVVSVLVLPTATLAQSVAPQDERDVRQAVERFLTLVREPGGWKIAAIAYTSMPARP